MAGSVRLSGPAPEGGASVRMTVSSRPALPVPPAVIVTMGDTESTFQTVAGKVTAPRHVTVTAEYGGETRAAAVDIEPTRRADGGA